MCIILYTYIQLVPIIDPSIFHHIHVPSPSVCPFTVLHTPQAAETKAAVPEVSGRVFVQAAAHAEVGQRPRIPGHQLGVAQGTVDATAMCDENGGFEWNFFEDFG